MSKGRRRRAVATRTPTVRPLPGVAGARTHAAAPVAGPVAGPRPEAPRDAGQSGTEDRILSAFLRVATRHGLEAATTRAVAAEAGVNEVTLFRHFGDKATLARRAVRRFSPEPVIAAWNADIDARSPRRAARGLLACFRLLGDILRTHPELFLFGITESQRLPELAEEVAAIPQAVHRFLVRALRAARPALRRGVDPEVTALQWMGLLLVTGLTSARGVMPTRDAEAWDRMVRASVRAVVRGAPKLNAKRQALSQRGRAPFPGHADAPPSAAVAAPTAPREVPDTLTGGPPPGGSDADGSDAGATGGGSVAGDGKSPATEASAEAACVPGAAGPAHPGADAGAASSDRTARADAGPSANPPHAAGSQGPAAAQALLPVGAPSAPRGTTTARRRTPAPEPKPAERAGLAGSPAHGPDPAQTVAGTPAAAGSPTDTPLPAQPASPAAKPRRARPRSPGSSGSAGSSSSSGSARPRHQKTGGG